MKKIDRLLTELITAEENLTHATFIAPCVAGGMVQTRIAGLVQTFQPQQKTFSGWAIFKPINSKMARIVEEATLPLVMRYLEIMPKLRARLIYRLQNQSWLAYPVNEADMQQRFKIVKPFVVHLTMEGAPFEQFIARTDGKTWWFEDLDRRADPVIGSVLRNQLEKLTAPEEIKLPNISPELHAAYTLAYKNRRAEVARTQKANGETRLRMALQMGGAKLHDFHDRGEHWVIEWATRNGEKHTSAINKNDLTVLSSGICLSGRDRDFDLQSLVTVIEQRH